MSEINIYFRPCIAVTVARLSFAIMTGGMAIGQFGTANQDVVKASVSANKFFAVRDRKPEIRAPDGGQPVKMGAELAGRIKFEEVSFRYPTAPDTQVLDKVSFEVEAGTTMAIVGPSGSGKSTIVNLLERYYDPEDGDITVDGEKIHNYDIHQLRRKIGYVSQLPLLFAGRSQASHACLSDCVFMHPCSCTNQSR